MKIYDLRNMKALPPIPFSAGPAFINRFPNRPSTLAITSNQGLVQIVDTTNPTSNEFYQVCRSTLFRGTLLDTAVSSTHHHSSVQWRFLRQLRTWLSGIQMVPCICCPLPKTNTKEGEFDAYATGDLVVPHPTVPGLWKIVGRLDEQIVLSNGEKVRTLASYHMAALQLIVSFV